MRWWRVGLAWVMTWALVGTACLVSSGSGPTGTTRRIPLAPEGTPLRAIQDRGKLIVGVKYDQPGFGYLDPKTNQLTGLDEAIEALNNGRVEVVSTDEAILVGYQIQSPDRYKLVGGRFTVEPYAMGVPKGHTDVSAAVNTALRTISKSGEWARLYEKNLPGLKAPAPPPADWREVYRMRPSGI